MNIEMIRTIASKLGSLLNLQAAIISLVVTVAVAIPVIGGTNAEFTAVTTNPGNMFRTAVLSMSTDHPSRSFIDIGNMVPGYTAPRAVTVQNTGSISFTYTITASSQGGPETLLWKNKSQGIQVILSGDIGLIYDGPISGLVSIPSGTMVPSGGTEVLTFVFSLPNAAGRAFQGLSQSIGVTYNATQSSGIGR